MVHPLIPTEDPPQTRQTSIHCHLPELSLISLEFSNFLNVLLTLQNIRFLKYIFKWNFVAIPLNEASIKIHKPCYSCRFLTQPLSQHIPSGFFFLFYQTHIPLCVLPVALFDYRKSVTWISAFVPFKMNRSIVLAVSQIAFRIPKVLFSFFFSLQSAKISFNSCL